MKRFAFILSLFTPIMFATDSFATSISFAEINQENSFLTNLINLGLTPYAGIMGPQSSMGISCGYTPEEAPVYIEEHIREGDNDGDGFMDKTEGRTNNVWWASSANNDNEQVQNFLSGYASCNNTAGTSYFNNGAYVYNGDMESYDAVYPSDRNGGHCWCSLEIVRFNNYFVSSYSYETQESRTHWIYLGDLGASCYNPSSENNCATACALMFSNGGVPSFYNPVFGSSWIDDEYITACPVSGGGSTPARAPLRVAAATHNASENALVSAAYARGAYNANVANINNAIEYMEDSSVATINSAKVSADNVSLTVNGFTPSGTVSVNSSNATVSGTFNVPTTVALMDSWGATTTTNATLGGIQQANITNGGISGLSATFTGTASGNLSGTGSFSNASVHVDGWRPVNPQE